MPRNRFPSLQAAVCRSAGLRVRQRVAGRWAHDVAGDRVGGLVVALALGGADGLHVVGVLVPTSLDRVDELLDEQANGLEGVVVAGDHDVDIVRIAVRVENADDDDAHLAGLADGVAFTRGIDDDHRAGHLVHLADTAEVALDLAELAVDLGDLLLGQLLCVDRLFVDRFELGEALQAAADNAEVRQRAADPTLGDDRHAGALTGVLDHALDLTLRSDPEHRLALGSDAEEEVLGAEEPLHGLAQIDHVDHSATTVDVRGHLRIPPRHAASEVHASFDELLCVDITHGFLERVK